MKKTPIFNTISPRTPEKRSGLLIGSISALCLLSANAFGHVISPEDHHAFEHKYSELCVKKELAQRKKENKTSGNIDTADPALQKLCDCIAQEESKTLTKEEVKKFLREGKYPMSLMIKASQAEEVCSGK